VTNSCLFKIIAHAPAPAAPPWGHPAAACISLALGAAIGACRVVRDHETGAYRPYNQKDGWGLGPWGSPLFPSEERFPASGEFCERF
jgi:hypothetical protein